MIEAKESLCKVYQKITFLSLVNYHMNRLMLLFNRFVHNYFGSQSHALVFTVQSLYLQRLLKNGLKKPKSAYL